MEIINYFSWKVNIKNRKRLGSFQVPIELVERHKLVDGNILTVEMYQNGKRILSFPERMLSSGCEILIPKVYQSKIERSFPLEIRIASDELLVTNEVYEDEIEAASVIEGKEKVRLHRYKERKPSLVKKAKEVWIKSDPKLHCIVCEFSFKEKYGTLGENFIEAHHRLPLSKLNEETIIEIKDLVPVCSNCHRMLHRKLKVLTIDELKIQVDKIIDYAK